MTAFPQLTGPCSFLKKIRLALHDLLSMNTRWPLNNYLLFFLLMKYLLFSLKIFLLAGGNGNLYSPIALCLPLKKRDHRKCFVDTSLDEVSFSCSDSRAIPNSPSKLEWKTGLPWVLYSLVERLVLTYTSRGS